MNGLTLRISGGGSNKTKNNISFPTVAIPEKDYLIGGENEEVQKFFKASNVEEQLITLKNILNSSTSPFSDELIKFLVIIFLQAEVKHPVKCFLTRYITKSDNLQHPFSIALSEEITRHIADRTTSYSNYKNVVTKVASCIENFPAGDVAVKMVEIELAEYLVYGLTHFVKILRSQTDSALSPTEKNEYFILVHSMLRIMLYVIQRVTDNSDKLITMILEIRANLKDLFFDEDVPMDTKSVCGIVYVSMHILENGPDSWVYILTAEDKDKILHSLLSNHASKLSIYSALVIVVPAIELQTHLIDGVPAIIALTENIINIGESTSSESTFNLGVTRTLVQISKCLERNIEKQTGLQLVDTLLLYVWPHLEHYMDSVRHLSAQALANVVRYCTGLQAGGDTSALDKLFSALDSLDRNRKSFYVSLTALTAELGAGPVMARMPDLVEHVLAGLHVQAVQASATTALETLLHAHMSRSSSEEIYQRWVKPIVAHAATADCIQLGILEDLLSKAVRLHDRIMEFILPHIQETCGEHNDSPYELKCVLMLLSVARRAGAVRHAGCPPCAGRWGGVIGYHVLRRAAVDPLHQTRILSLSLIVESPKSTEVFTGEELDFVLYFLKYNCNAQAPNFRQLVLSLMKKFVKRFEDSYKVLLRQKDTNEAENKTDYYLQFVESLRAQCFDSLFLGANYGRRYVALQVLVWCEYMQLDGYERNWTTEYIYKLIDRLGDSYENNKAFALEVLKRCPPRLLKGFGYWLNMEKVVSLASSVKPADCAWAAYTLQLLLEKLPHEILQGEGCSGTPEAVTYKLLCRLVSELQKQLAVCRDSVVGAARDAPMYGLLHCITHVMDRLDAEVISQDDAWTALIAEIISTCIEVNAAVACVVNNSSPEGHLPMDMGGVEVTDHGNSGNVRLDDGRPVTAQMVLLCAWRSVKEVSLLLGSICSRLVISSPDSKGSLQARQLVAVGEHFTKLLSETKHRGAFEQAYVGFCRLLTRLWRCRSPELHELPKAWLDELMLAIQSPEAHGKLCATRRSAGLPFMIQALVSTELQVRGHPTCFHACMCALVRVARDAPGVTSRTHAANILRALVRHAALHDAAAPHAGPALLAALAGFQGGTWEERNSSTLLFSALTVRIFGVQRSRDLEKLCIRNRMTGRIFFLRYPQLYDLMLGELEASSRHDRDLLRPLLYPILLLLARLYPSSLEGTVSNLKLVAFIPHVVACARSGVLKTRQLAAKAIVPLISPEQYVPHLQEMLNVLRDENINRNYCHGILLQINRLIDNKPDLQLDSEAESSIMEQISASTWIVKQSSRLPCYLIVDEYIKMISLLLWRFSSLPYSEIIDTVTNSLNDMLFNNHIPEITSGRDVCLANAAYLLFIISNLFKTDGTTYELLLKCLSHKSYEVILSALNYILILHEEIEIDDKLPTHLSIVSKKETLERLNNPTVYSKLCDIIKSNRYLECSQKALQVLTLSGDTQTYIIQAKQDDIEVTHETVLKKLIHFIENEHENMTHIYLQSLSNFLTKMLNDNAISSKSILEAIRVVFACSLSDNSDHTRKVVVSFLDANIEQLLELDLKDLPEEERFEFKATLYSTLVTMLEDDDVSLSQRTCDLICRALGVPCGVIPGRCGEMLRDHIEKDGDAIALFTALALLDFKSEVVVTDEESDEYRVFDQNERYNIYLEETVWTKACAEKIASIHKDHETLLVSIEALTRNKTYKPALDKLCGSFHLGVFGYFVMKTNKISNIENIKSEVFAKVLHEYELKLRQAKFLALNKIKENIE